MNCTDFPWTALFDKEMDETKKAEAQAHLAECPDCRRKSGLMEKLISEVVRNAEVYRLACPTPEELVSAATGESAADTMAHLESCEACRKEFAAIKEVEAEVNIEKLPLPSFLASKLNEAKAVTPRQLMAELMAHVRSRVGEANALYEGFRRFLAEGAAQLDAEPELSPAFGAQATGAGAQNLSATIKIIVESSPLEIEIRLQGQYSRVDVSKQGLPATGVSVSQENVLGEMLETQCDTRGSAAIFDDLSGDRRITIKIP